MKTGRLVLGAVSLAIGIAAFTVCVFLAIQENIGLDITIYTIMGLILMGGWFLASFLAKVAMIANFKKSKFNLVAITYFLALFGACLITTTKKVVPVEPDIFILIAIWIYGWPIIDTVDWIFFRPK